MKIFISVDIEGVAGVFQKLQGQRGNPEYEVARRLMTQEANAAIRGAFCGGATEVLVADSHGAMQNLIASDLDPRARLVQGKPRSVSMLHGLTSEFAGIVLIGFHAAAGNRGTLAHTISGLAFSKIEINGICAGEVTLFGGHAAELGVPLLSVSGDDLLADEIREQFPQTAPVIVKRALGYSATDSLSPTASRDLIENMVKEAVRKADTARPNMPTTVPLEAIIRLSSQQLTDVVVLMPNINRIDACTIRIKTSTYAELINLMSVMAVLAKGLA